MDLCDCEMKLNQKEEKEKGKSNKSTNFQTNKLVCQNFDDNLVLSC